MGSLSSNQKNNQKIQVECLSCQHTVKIKEANDCNVQISDNSGITVSSKTFLSLRNSYFIDQGCSNSSKKCFRVICQQCCKKGYIFRYFLERFQKQLTQLIQERVSKEITKVKKQEIAIFRNFQNLIKELVLFEQQVNKLEERPIQQTISLRKIVEQNVSRTSFSTIELQMINFSSKLKEENEACQKKIEIYSSVKKQSYYTLMQRVQDGDRKLFNKNDEQYLSTHYQSCLRRLKNKMKQIQQLKKQQKIMLDKFRRQRQLNKSWYILY